MDIEVMSELDLQRLKPEVLRQKKAVNTAVWASIGLNVILWSIFIFVPTGEVLGAAVFGPVVAAVLLGVTLKSGKLLKQDLKTKKKELIKGQIQLKSSIQFNHSTAYEFIIDEVKYPVTLTVFAAFNELDRVVLERTYFGKTILSCRKADD
jgi:hypothetical protein